MTIDLFSDDALMQRISIAPGATLLRGFALADAPALLAQIHAISAQAPFRHLVTPGGHTMSVALTCCGSVGWTSDRGGYRYAAVDPASGEPWPALPAVFLALATHAAQAAGFEGLEPDSCLVNRYIPGSKLTLHQDRDELDLRAPIVSVSLGLPARFLFGGTRRNDRVQRMPVQHGDVVVWGGPARLAYHGIAPLAAGEHAITGAVRFNLTFRKTC